MAALDLEVLRKGRPEDEFEAEGEPETRRGSSPAAPLLADHKWGRGHWGEFELLARANGRNKVLKRSGAPRGGAGGKS